MNFLVSKEPDKIKKKKHDHEHNEFMSKRKRMKIVVHVIKNES